MLNDDIPPRPRWNHRCVKEATARQFVDQVRDWAECMGAVEEDADPNEFLAVMALALIESPDAYHAGRYLEDFIGWPVNGDLINIFDTAYASMKYVVRDFVHVWVMENNVRFPAKSGDLIRCKIGDVEINGHVLEVIRTEAKGIVVPTGRDRPMPVHAEEVVQILPPRKPRKKKPDAPQTA